MIDYDPGYWGVMFVVDGVGVLSRACVWGIGAAVMTVIVHCMLEEFAGVASYFKSYLTFLIFLLVFRTQVAHSRLNEGVMLLLKIRGHWCSAYASLLNSCSRSEANAKEVKDFQQLLVRLMSILHSVAMQEIAEIEHGARDMGILGDDGIDPTYMDYLKHTTDKVQVVGQWIAMIVHEADKKKIIEVSPPALGRIFQELANGNCATTQAWKFREVPFPFPHAQMLTALLLVTTFIMPFISLEVSNIFMAPFLTCLAVTAMWSVNYTAQELEEPFGDDIDDFPVWKMQKSFNSSLEVLLSPMCLSPPSFNSDIARNLTMTNEAMRRQDSGATMALVRSSNCETQLKKSESRGVLNDAVKDPANGQGCSKELKGVPQNQGVLADPVKYPPQTESALKWPPSQTPNGTQNDLKDPSGDARQSQALLQASPSDFNDGIKPRVGDDVGDIPVPASCSSRRSTLGKVPLIGTE
eukprot:TRINITY_DN6678_c1_g1_i5.p1 TRINITY_DN6678_c1_g1~~TRINITY_DN6678_c1_g1_i5.p1  ORF type:complete len:494 (-),score=73.42 TRINITY_DN6678_c1_g1_i5:143-1543(-)